MGVGGTMAGKGAKGLLMGKAPILSHHDDHRNKDKKKPISRSAKAGLQVCLSVFFPFFLYCDLLPIMLQLCLLLALWRSL